MPVVLTRITQWYASGHWSGLEGLRDQGRGCESSQKAGPRAGIVSQHHGPVVALPAWVILAGPRCRCIPSHLCKLLKGRNRALTITVPRCPAVFLAKGEQGGTVWPISRR